MSEHILAHEVTRVDVEPDQAEAEDGEVAIAATVATHTVVAAVDGPDGQPAGVAAETTTIRCQRYVPADSPRMRRLRWEADNPATDEEGTET